MLSSVALFHCLVSFDEVAKQSDFLAVCCALTPETKEICNKNLFSKMKNTSIFINTSRYSHLNCSTQQCVKFKFKFSITS